MTQTTSDFADQPHIEQIRQRLWSGREYGSAAVFVGSGFSRNADRVSIGTKPFPLWRELSEVLFSSLYPSGTLDNYEAEKRKIKSETVGEALKLANEYEVFFSRAALEKLIVDSIPDSKYTPGRLHEILLSLPWSDVFTTNYDTLLERTQPAIIERRYDLVLTTSDIPNSVKPRIVKLHGSFPSHRPFIVTQEDYRVYPSTHAPFVNMVQQAIMENLLCLIGFSGDDPNFLYWTGWVRDNLGSSMPPIYLCGILDLSVSQRKLLESRNITPVDLSPLFPQSRYPDLNIRHSKAMEWLLLNLWNGAPPNILSWPTPYKIDMWKPSSNLPPIPPGPKALTNLSRYRPVTLTSEKDELQELLNSWKEKRLEYPGWVVAPQSSREDLWMQTKYWIHTVFDSIHKLTSPDDLSLLYELNWRLEKTLTPLTTEWVSQITPIIESYNPFPYFLELEKAQIRPDREEYQYLDWGKISEMWVELLFAVAREAREDMDEKQFWPRMDQLKKLLPLHKEWQCRWHYEECLFALSTFNLERLWKALDDWPETSDLPFWEVRRASILAELGNLKESERIAEAALFEIRSSLRSNCENFQLLSQEGWAMLLLRLIKGNRFGSPNEDVLGQYRDRWEKLDSYKCNPWTEIERMRAALKDTIPTFNDSKEIKKGFDPGYSTTSRTSTAEHPFFMVRPAFAVLRVMEEAALPVICGHIAAFTDAVNASSKWIEPFAPLWAISTLVRSGNEKELDELFPRVRVAGLKGADVEHLFNLLINALRQSIKRIEENPHEGKFIPGSLARRLVPILTDLVSRLCVRISEVQLDQAFRLALDIYSLPLFRNDIGLNKHLSDIFLRLLSTMHQEEILKRMPDLLSLPIPGDNGFQVFDPSRWHEPFDYISWRQDSKLSNDIDRSSWTPLIKRLIDIVAEGPLEARGRAALRLERLYEIDALTVQEKESFGEALWSRVDKEKGLPSETLFYDFVFMSLPVPQSCTAREAFRNYVVSSEIPRLVTTSADGKKTRSSTSYRKNQHYFEELRQGTLPLLPDEDDKERFIDWTQDEAAEFSKKAIAWWSEEKGEFRRDDPLGLSEEAKSSFQYLVRVMAEVILPRLNDADAEIKQAALNLLYDMEASGLIVSEALPSLLFLDPDLYDGIARKIRYALNSIEEDEVEAAISGIISWLIYGNAGRIQQPPNDLLDEIVNRVVGRRQPGLLKAILELKTIFKRFHTVLKEEQINKSLIAVEYLLKETEIGNQQEISIRGNNPGPIAILDYPEYRQFSASLAFSLYKFLQGQGKDIPQILIEWQKVCQTDLLPEVRKAWQ